MSIRIRVSYTEDGEITDIIGALSKVMKVKSYKIRSQKGHYKTAYICAGKDCKMGPRRL